MQSSDREGTASHAMVFRIISSQKETGRIVPSWPQFLAESPASPNFGTPTTLARAHTHDGLTVEVSSGEDKSFRIDVKQGDELIVVGHLPADRRVEDEVATAVGHARDILPARKDAAAMLACYDRPLTREEYEGACLQHGVEMLTAEEESRGWFSYQYAPVVDPLKMEIRRFLARRRLDAVRIAHMKHHEAFMQQCEEPPSLAEVLANKDYRARHIITANFEVLRSGLHAAMSKRTVYEFDSVRAFLDVAEDGKILKVAPYAGSVEVRFVQLDSIIVGVSAPLLSASASDLLLCALKAWAHANRVRWHKSASRQGGPAARS